MIPENIVSNVRDALYDESYAPLLVGIETQEILSEEIARALQKVGGFYIVKNNPEFFPKFSKEFLDILIEAGYDRDFILANPDKFDGLTPEGEEKIVDAMIQVYDGEQVVQNMGHLHIEPARIAQKLMANGMARYVMMYLDQFTGVDHTEIAEKMVEIDDVETLMYHAEKLQGVDFISILSRIIAEDRGIHHIFSAMEKMTGLDYQKVYNLLMEYNRYSILSRNLRYFEGKNIDCTALADILIDQDNGSLVYENIRYFSGADHEKIAQKLIEKGYKESVGSYIDDFQGISEATKKQFQL